MVPFSNWFDKKDKINKPWYGWMGKEIDRMEMGRDDMDPAG